MNAILRRNARELVVFPVLMVLVTVYVVTCAREPGPDPGPGAPGVAGDCTYSAYNTTDLSSVSSLLPVVSLDCPALPDTPPRFSTPATTPSSFFEHFAWKSFIAVNWPAVNTSAHANHPRGFPASNQTFTSENDPSLTVWETWKEKRELFVFGAQPPPDPGPWNSLVDYHNEDIPDCSGEGQELIAARRRAGMRYLLQVGKSSAFNSLDESVEVPSEAGPTTTIAGGLVEPRIFRGLPNGTPDTTRPVLYEVKLNYDYYNYTVNNFNSTLHDVLYNDTTKRQRAALSGNWSRFHQGNPSTANVAINFPRRQNYPAYNASQCEQFNQNFNQSHPCVTGTIQAKAAWVQALPGDGIDYSTYHTSEALFYRDDPGSDLGVCVDSGTFALVGLHIIQKTASQPFYLYASWEHEGLEQQNFVYSNFKLFTDRFGTQGFHPPLDGSAGIEVKRDHPITNTTNSTIAQVNQAYQRAIAGNNSNSVWQHYQLIGTQFFPVDTSNTSGTFAVGSNDPTGIGQPFYMANLLVETNWGLQNFQGVPPGQLPLIGPTPPYSPTQGYLTEYNNGTAYKPNPSEGFNRTLPNLGSARSGQGGKVFNMGGCMGCHGIAQGNGADFSFVLLFGQQGALPDSINGTPVLPQ